MIDLNDHMLIIEKVLLLKSLDLFRHTPEPVLADLAPLMEKTSFNADDVIFEEGEPGDCMYIIMNGEIIIRKAGMQLAVLSEKDVLGELALLDTETRSATAVAKTDCGMYRIWQEPFYELLDTRPEIARGFIELLCHRLRVLNARASEMKV